MSLWLERYPVVSNAPSNDGMFELVLAASVGDGCSISELPRCRIVRVILSRTTHPSLFQWQGVVHSERAGAAHQHARYASCRIGVVTGHTVVAAGESWLAEQCSIEHIENHTLLRVLRGELDDTAPDPPDRDRLIEVEGSRIAHVDARALKLSFAKTAI